MAEKKKNPQALRAPKKMMLLFTIVNRNKAEFYMDLLEGFEVNMQLALSATGTAGTEIRSLLGLSNNERTVIISVIKKERSEDALSALDEKFRSIRGGKGIAYTVPLSSTIGVAIYKFLSNTAG